MAQWEAIVPAVTTGAVTAIAAWLTHRRQRKASDQDYNVRRLELIQQSYEHLVDDLSEEIQRLQTRISTLETELRQAKKKINDLEERSK